MSSYYVSKRDGWLVAVIWGASALATAALAPVLWVARFEPLAWLGGVAGAVGMGLGPWILYGTGYVFESDHLLVRSGPFRWRIPFSEISFVEPSANPLSSPACSLDRLLIQYGPRQILVSPADRLGFLSRLAGLCPQLLLEGERLTPRATRERHPA